MPSWRQLSAQRGFYFFPGETGACTPVANNVGNWGPFNIPGNYYLEPELYNHPRDAIWPWDASDHRPNLALYDYQKQDRPFLQPQIDSLARGIVLTPRIWRECQIYGEFPSAAPGDIEGQAVGTASLRGTPSGLGALTGRAQGTASLRGTLTGLAPITGQLFGTASLRGTISGVGALTGRLIGTARLVGQATGLGALLGRVFGVAASRAIPSGLGILTGRAQGTAALHGNVTATGALTGRLFGTATTTGVLTAPTGGDITGRLFGTATLTGTLSGLVVVVPDLGGAAMFPQRPARIRDLFPQTVPDEIDVESEVEEVLILWR